jgi:molybdate transport system substrate-binding protein
MVASRAFKLLSAAVAGGMVAMIGGTQVSTHANAAEIVIYSTIAAEEALHDIVPMFERASGHKVNITFGAGPDLVTKIRSGLTADLFIGPSDFTDPLTKEGKLVADSRVDFARSGNGIAVRKGVPKPDVSTPEKFKAALVAAKTVSYSRGVSGLHFVGVLEKLGIAEEVKAKLVPPQGRELVGTVVARGDAEIGVQQFSELLPVEGIEILGPLPGDLQRFMVYGVNAMPGTTQPAAAKEFVSFLKSEPAAAIIKKKGMEPT